MKGVYDTFMGLAGASLLKKIIGTVFSFLVSMYFELNSIVLSMWFLMFVDVYLAIKKENLKKGVSSHLFSYSFWVSIRARKLHRTIDKGVSYLLIMICVFVLTKYIIKTEYLDLSFVNIPLVELTAGILAFVELWSIGEKFGFIYGLNPVKLIFEYIRHNKDFSEIDKALNTKNEIKSKDNINKNQ